MESIPNRDDILQLAQTLKDQGQLSPGMLADKAPDTKLNIVFDVDHTLIFAIDKALNPNLMAELNGKSDIVEMKVPCPGR